MNTNDPMASVDREMGEFIRCIEDLRQDLGVFGCEVLDDILSLQYIQEEGRMFKQAADLTSSIHNAIKERKIELDRAVALNSLIEIFTVTLALRIKLQELHNKQKYFHPENKNMH